ncbi:MAG: hypothetical protein AVDCRST_MAG08-1831 [uncultured Acetobacteraceae bacterium]|uniref:Uncharacterized protein n=1 Tax=uncultured Acetobacteraceae bacterium TaxID=169975 RepID=A0A6J4I8E9_9PROT|nr:MAG: hypothetical protein AVDCRST_MAG08-1831 [uncultured Acetobacteraceae bacterium]
MPAGGITDAAGPDNRDGSGAPAGSRPRGAVVPRRLKRVPRRTAAVPVRAAR